MGGLDPPIQSSESGFVALDGRLKAGHLALQGDHEGVLAFRNIRVRELK